MENVDKILSLQSLLEDDTLDASVADNVSLMIRREKEKTVLQQHKYKIAGPFKSRDREIYRTTAPWMDGGRLNRNSYDDLIDALYEHYFNNTIQDYTVRQMYEAMIEHFEKDHIVSNLTLTHYKADWNKYIVEKGCEWLDMSITKVLPEQIFEHYKLLTAGETMKRSTFNNVKTVVNAVFDYAINKNVTCTKASLVSTKRLRFAPVVDKWDGVYTLADKQKILKACEDAKPTVYIKGIELMFSLDIRIGELRALQKSDVDLQNGTINVAHQMVDVETDTAKRHPVRVDIMKGKQEAGKRVQPLSKRAERVIRELFEAYPDTVWLLPNKSQNEPIYTNRFNENLRKICKKAGVKYFSSHGIRFHNISAMYDAGVNEKEIQRLSGHTTANMTRHYNKSISTIDESAKIRAILG